MWQLYKQKGQNKNSAVVKCEQCGQKLKLIFSYNKEIIEIIKKLPNRQYLPDDKTWQINVENRVQMEKLFSENRIKFEYSSTIVKMKDGNYKSLEETGNSGNKSEYFQNNQIKTTLKLELVDEHNFVVRKLGLH